MKPAIIVAAIAVVAAAGARAQTVSADEGHRLVERDCAQCHAVERTGESPNPAAPHFRDLHFTYPINQLAQALTEGTIAGHPPMPPYHLTPTEIADIIRYLTSIQTEQQSRAAPVPAGDGL
ncbi:MAG TPA: cytochrome c [Caulobacteraceae bacterium]|nr:cytochrome c [Caulobacteraceae bacterium]